MNRDLSNIDFEQIHRFSAPSSQFSCALGRMIDDTLTLSNMTRAQATERLSTDPELIEAIGGYMTLGLLVSCTMGGVKIEVLELVLQKVCDVCGAVMEFA